MRMKVLWKDRRELSRGAQWIKTKKRLALDDVFRISSLCFLAYKAVSEGKKRELRHYVQVFMKYDNERVKNRTIAKTEIQLVKFIQRQKGEGGPRDALSLLEGRGKEASDEEKKIVERLMSMGTMTIAVRNRKYHEIEFCPILFSF